MDKSTMDDNNIHTSSNSAIDDPQHSPNSTTTDTDSQMSPNTPARIIDIVKCDTTSEDVENSKSEQLITVVEKRHRMMRRNAIVDFYRDGKRNIKRLFPDDTSPEHLKWKNFRIKKKKNSEEVKKVSTSKCQNVKEYSASPRRESPIRCGSPKESSRPLTSISANEIVSESSILSSYKVMTMINDYTKENTEEPDELDMDNLFEHWIAEFIDTCQRQIKNTVMATNTHLAQYLDLNGVTLSTDHENFIKVNTVPTWTQVRILEDNTNQKYIALKKSHSLSWFIMPRESPKLNQRWVCYPITSMNTLENELRLTDESSIQWLILRMIMLKCFHKVYKSDIVPIKFDIGNILLVSSTCGLIVVFKEDQHELDISSLKILKTPSLADVPKQWTCAKVDVRNAVTKFFYRLNIISVLISSIWPLDNLAYILVTLIMETDN